MVFEHARGSSKVVGKHLRRVDPRGTHFSRMFWYWFRAGPRMLKTTQPRAGTKRVATIAALLSPAAATSAIWLAASACSFQESESAVSGQAS